MGGIVIIIVFAIVLGTVALIAFFWTVRAGQYDDLAGAAERILIDDEENKPL